MEIPVEVRDAARITAVIVYVITLTLLGLFGLAVMATGHPITGVVMMITALFFLVLLIRYTTR